MTEELPELTPEEEAEVSRLLADAGGPLATPDDVVARLDATLADLVGSPDSPATATVVPLEARRRWPRLLLAAAAVVVGGYAVGSAVDGSVSGDGSSADSAGGAVSSEAAEDEAAPAPEELEPPADGGSTATKDQDERPVRELRDQLVVGTVVVLRSDRLAEDVEQVLAVSVSRRSLAYDATLAAARRCGPPPLERGQRWTPARYDGTRAVLVTGPASDGELPATVYGCDGTLLDETVVDAP